jgi:hypothetical protein
MPKYQHHSVNAEKLMSELNIVNINRYMSDKWNQRKRLRREKPLSLWNEDAASVKELISYVKRVTDKKSSDYIPPKDRVVVSDLDGTLFCETDPTYFDFRLFYYRVMEDPDYKDKASESEIKLARGVEEFINTGIIPPNFEVEIGNAIAQVFSGMTVEEFENYVLNFGNFPARGYNGMTQGEAFYKPMLQVLDYLQENEFVIFICSGTDRQVVRGLVGAGIEIPPRQVLGTEEVIVARDQGGVNGVDYYYSEEDELVLSGKIRDKNLKMNKVSMIAQVIGQQPVLCLGNSSGDYSMANYVCDNNKYSPRVFMLCCDDLERENGNLKKAAEMEEMCKKSGWVPVSMKNDWKTIYGEGVTKK